MTHGKPQLTMGTERRGHTYLVQILTAGKAETDPQEPGRQSETRDINKMRSLSSLEAGVPAVQDLSFLPGLLHASGSRTSFSLHGHVVRQAAIPTAAPVLCHSQEFLLKAPLTGLLGQIPFLPSAATKTRQPNFWTSPIISIYIQPMLIITPRSFKKCWKDYRSSLRTLKN